MHFPRCSFWIRAQDCLSISVPSLNLVHCSRPVEISNRVGVWQSIGNTCFPSSCHWITNLKISFVLTRTELDPAARFWRRPCGSAFLSISPLGGRGFPRGSVRKESACIPGDLASIPGLGRKWQPALVFSPGKSHGQRSLVGYSPGGCKSQARLSD